jgi:hypothetical protein
VELIDGDSSKTTTIGAAMDPKLESMLVEFLRKKRYLGMAAF